MTWIVRYADPSGTAHVVPIDDLRDHDPNECWCGAARDAEGIIVHNSLDQRETYERGRKLS